MRPGLCSSPLHLPKTQARYFRSTAVTTDQDITCICFPICERRHNMIRMLRESLEAMVEEHAIGIGFELWHRPARREDRRDEPDDR